MIRLWATILKRTECLCLQGRAGARARPGRVPECSFGESYKKGGGKLRAPPLPAAANSELVWRVQGRKVRPGGTVTHQRPHGYSGTDVGQRERNPASSDTCSILCVFLLGGRENQQIFIVTILGFLIFMSKQIFGHHWRSESGYPPTTGRNTLQGA